MFALSRVLSLRELARRQARSALITASIALGVVAWTTTWALNQALDASLQAASTPTTSATFYVSNGDSGIARELVSRVSAVAGVRSARPVVIERIRISGKRTVPAVLLGVDFAAYRDPETASLSIAPETAARFAKGLLFRQNPVLLGASLAREIGLEGDTATAMIGGRRRTLRTVGTLDPRGPLNVLGGSIVLTGDREAAAMVGHPGRVSRIDVTIEPGLEARTVRERVSKQIGQAGEVITPDAHDGRVQQSLGALRTGFALCGMGALALALFLVANVLGVSVAERQRTIGLLRALGSTCGQVRSEILGESLILGALGSLIGVPLGYAVAGLSLGPLLRAVGDVFIPLESRGITFDPTLAAGGVAAGLVTSLIAAWVPASKATAMTPSHAMSSSGGRPSISSRRRVVACCGLSLLAVVMFFGREGVTHTAWIYATLVLGLVGAILGIPLATGLLARLLRPIAEWVGGVPGRLAMDSLIRSPSRTGSTIAGLAGGVALMIQTGGVIQGNESAVRSWVDRCITGDLFLTSGGPMSASGRTIPMDISLLRQINATLPGARVVPMRFRHLDWSRNGEKTQVLLLVLDATSYVDMGSQRKPALRDLPLYRRLEQPGTALVSENFAALNGVTLGDAITLAGPDGPVSVKVVGTVVDFSNNRGTILVDRRGVGQTFAADAVDLFAVGLGDVDPESARLAVAQSNWAAEHAIEAMTRQSLRNHILGMIRRLYGVAYVQEIVAAIVAALGVSAAMLISIVQRRHELSLLRALGATSHQLFVTVIAEAAAMAAIGVTLGSLLGLALEWYVLRVIWLQETGFRFPVLVPWADAILVALVVGVAAIVSGVAPALSATRISTKIGLAHD